MLEIQASAQIALSRTFVMAHLLTASLDQAETACREALDVWNPEVEGDEVLLRYGVAAALRTTPGPSPARLNISLSGGSYLPAELRAVLKLPQPLRPCFALRMLGGFSATDCARLLRLGSRDIEKYTRSAVIRLATLNRQELKEGLMDQDTDCGTIEHLAYQLWLERGSPPDRISRRGLV
jgi:DNA-directed RNA polymerase specialized sigma24 family protein